MKVERVVHRTIHKNGDSWSLPPGGEIVYITEVDGPINRHLVVWWVNNADGWITRHP